MSEYLSKQPRPGHAQSIGTEGALSPGKRTLTEQIEAPGRGEPVGGVPIQRRPADAGPLPPPLAPGRDRLLRLFGVPAAAIQRKAEGTHAPVGDAASEDRVTVPAGGGRPLAEAVRQRMETSFGVDFSGVRVHEGGYAADVGARAYTQGTDIHFAPGEYQPDSPASRELLGHELTHVVQQSQGRVQATTQAKGLAVNCDTGLEREADEVGARAARGEDVRGFAGGSASADGGLPVLQAPGHTAQGVFKGLTAEEAEKQISDSGLNQDGMDVALGRIGHKKEYILENAISSLGKKYGFKGKNEEKHEDEDDEHESKHKTKRKRENTEDKDNDHNKEDDDRGERPKRRKQEKKPESKPGKLKKEGGSEGEHDAEHGKHASRWNAYQVPSILYHATDTMQVGQELRDQPTYFSVRPQNHRKILLQFQSGTTSQVVDLSDLESVNCVYGMARHSSREDIVKILVYKTKATVVDAKVTKVGGFRSPSREDDAVLDRWFKEVGLPGWYGPLGFADEVMLVSTAGMSNAQKPSSL